MLKIKILYSTVRDTTKFLANLINNDLSRIFDCELINTKDYTKINFSEEQVLILVTCTYRGKPSYDALEFWRWLNNDENKSFHNLKLAVLGIGHSNYKNTYCKAAKDFEEKIINYGATRLVTGPLGIEGIYGGPIGIANEMTNFKEARLWMDHLEETLIKIDNTNQYTIQPIVKEVIQHIVNLTLKEFSHCTVSKRDSTIGRDSQSIT